MPPRRGLRFHAAGVVAIRRRSVRPCSRSPALR